MVCREGADSRGQNPGYGGQGDQSLGGGYQSSQGQGGNYQGQGQGSSYQTSQGQGGNYQGQGQSQSGNYQGQGVGSNLGTTGGYGTSTGSDYGSGLANRQVCCPMNLQIIPDLQFFLVSLLFAFAFETFNFWSHTCSSSIVEPTSADAHMCGHVHCACSGKHISAPMCLVPVLSFSLLSNDPLIR